MKSRGGARGRFSNARFEKPMENTQALNHFFQFTLPSLKAGGLKYAQTHGGFSMEELCAYRWVDGRGRGWSLLSWMGHRFATSTPDSGLDVGLLVDVLQLYENSPLIALGLAWQSEPSEPDVLWAWLGHYSERGQQNDWFYTAIAPLFRGVKEPPLSISAEGEPGGWLLQALGLMTRWAEKKRAPFKFRTIAGTLLTQLVFAPRIAKVDLDDFRTYGFRAMATLLPKGDRIPGVGPCIHDAQVLRGGVGPLFKAAAMLEGLAEKPEPGFGLMLYPYMRAAPYREVWQAIVGDFDEAAWAALEHYARVGLLQSHVVGAGSLAAFALMKVCGRSFEGKAELEIHRRVCEVSLSDDPGQSPPSTLAAFHGWYQIAPLVRWIREAPLDISLPGASAPSGRVRF